MNFKISTEKILHQIWHPFLVKQFPQTRRGLLFYLGWNPHSTLMPLCSVSQACLTLRDSMDCSPRLLFPWDSPGKNTGEGCHFLLQGICPTQGLTPCLLYLLHWQAGSLPLHHPGSPLVSLGVGDFNFLRRAVSFPLSRCFSLEHMEHLGY